MASKSTIEVKILGDNRGLSSSLDESESKIGTFASNAGKLAAGAALAVGGAVVVALGKGFTDALGAQDNNALIGAQLGLDPKAAAEIGDAAAGAYRDAWGSSLEEVSNTAVAITKGFTGPLGGSLETLTGQAQAMAQTFGVDVTAAVQTASEMVSAGLVSDAESAFDLLTAGLQKMPVAIRDELLEASNEYGTFFSSLGLTGNEAFGILVKGAENGVYGIDKAGDAIKEFTIRSTDMSSSTADAYAAIGEDSWEMANAILAGGDQARGAFDDIIGGLLAMEDPAAQAQAAIALFGTPLEDIGVSEIPDFLAALQSGAGGMGDFTDAADTMADTVGGTTSSKLEAFKRKALGGLADFAANNLLPPFESFLAWSEKNWPKIQETVEDAFESVKKNWERYGQPVFDAVVDAGEDVVDFFVDNWPKVQETVAEVFDWIKNNKDVVIGALVGLGVAVATILVPAFIGWAASATAAAAATLIAIAPFVAVGAAVAAIGAAAVWAYQNVDWFRDAVDAVARFFVDTVWPILQQTWQVITDVVTGIVATVRENWDTIEAIVTTVLDAVWGHVEAVWNAIYGIVDGYITAVRGVIQVVTSLIRGDWEGVWDGIKKFIDGIWTTIKAIVVGAIDIVKNYLSTVMGVISDAWSTIWGGIATRVSNVWQSIKGYVETGIDAVVGFIGGLPGRVASAVGDGFSAIWNKFRDVVNRIIRTWNSLAFKFPQFDGDWNGPLPGGGFTVGGWSLSVRGSGLALPEFHNGIDRVPGRRGAEMLAILEAGERVIPADQNIAGGGPITLIIEGRPFTAMIAEHENAQVAELMAGAR